MALPESVEMIRLMGLKIRRRKIVCPVSSGHMLVRPERGWCGTQAYMLNRRGMEKILSVAHRIYEPIDKFYDHFWEYDLQLYGVEPHLVYELEGNSNVKRNPSPIKNTSVWSWSGFHMAKLLRSRGRHRYLKLNKEAFYPCGFPVDRPGRTKRMR